MSAFFVPSFYILGRDIEMPPLWAGPAVYLFLAPITGAVKNYWHLGVEPAGRLERETVREKEPIGFVKTFYQDKAGPKPAIGFIK